MSKMILNSSKIQRYYDLKLSFTIIEFFSKLCNYLYLFTYEKLFAYSKLKVN